MRLLIAVTVWIGALVAAAAVSSVVAGSIHHQATAAAVTDGPSRHGSGASAPGSTKASPPTGRVVDPSSITATDPASLFRPANLARALTAARTQLGATAKVENFALYPGYLSLTAVKGRTEVEFYADANGRSMRTGTGGSAGGLGLFSLTRVQPGVPAAIMRRIATAARVPASRLHYMVAQTDPSTNRFRWLVYPVQGSRVEYFQAVGATGPLLEYRADSSSGLQPVSP